MNVLNTTSFSGALTGTGSNAALTKTGTGTLILAGNNTYAGATTINAGTLQIGNGGTTGSLSLSSAITVNGTLAFNRSNTITQGTHFNSVISGSGGVTMSGTGILNLSGSNSYSGNTTINSGTLVIGNPSAAGTGRIIQNSGASLLQFDTAGTISNNLSVTKVLATQNATLSGTVTVNAATWEADTADTLAISGTISGSGGITKTGNGTLTLSGNNTFTGGTTVNAGTLNAASANALGPDSPVTVNGGTLLVSADDAINGKNITLGTNTIGLQFSGNYSGAIGNLTLSANSVIDLGSGHSVRLLLQGITFSNYTLSFYNWTGTTLCDGGTGADTDRVFLLPPIDPSDLDKISFYSGNYGTDSFLGTGVDLGLKATGFDPAWEIGRAHV